MQSTGARVALAVALIALAVVLFVLLSDGDEDDGGGPSGTATRQPVDASNGDDIPKGGPAPPAQPQIPTVTVRRGEPVGGVQTLEFTSGDRIRFTVRSDEAGEVHVHGYEITEPISAGASTTLAFPADLQGGYEIEVHGHQSGDVQVADLIVNPG